MNEGEGFSLQDQTRFAEGRITELERGATTAKDWVEEVEKFTKKRGAVNRKGDTPLPVMT